MSPCFNKHVPRLAAIGSWLGVAVALTGAALVAACTASSSKPTAGSHPLTPQPVAAGYACGLASFQQPAPPPGRIVLGVISIRPDEAFPTARVRQGSWNYWQKYPLWIRAGRQPVRITVPNARQTGTAITWGVNVGIASELVLPGCPSGGGTWNGYAGGFYLRSRAACVPLMFSVGRRSTLVRVGVGRRCAPVP